MISEEQESITYSPQSVSETAAEEQVEDSQFDKTSIVNPEQTFDTVLKAPSDNDSITNRYDVIPMPVKWAMHKLLFLLLRPRHMINVWYHQELDIMN